MSISNMESVKDNNSSCSSQREKQPVDQDIPQNSSVDANTQGKSNVTQLSFSQNWLLSFVTFTSIDKPITAKLQFRDVDAIFRF